MLSSGSFAESERKVSLTFSAHRESLFTDGEASEKLTRIACQHQKSKLGEDVGDGGKEDCSEAARKAA
jgi:hypothetical protein